MTNLKCFIFSERGSLNENNSTITNVKLLTVMEKFNFFENFKYLLMGGHDEKLKSFGKSKKKIGNLHELDNFEQKICFEKKISKLR